MDNIVLLISKTIQETQGETLNQPSNMPITVDTVHRLGDL